MEVFPSPTPLVRYCLTIRAKKVMQELQSELIYVQTVGQNTQ